MPILPTNTDYSDADFDSLRARLISLVSSVFPTWTQFQVAAFGTLLIEMFAFTGDVLTFYQNDNAAESRIVTARQRRNLLALASLVGYVPKLQSASTADLAISVNGTLAANCVIAAGQIFATPSGIKFQMLSPITLTPGSPTGVRTVENSTNAPAEIYAGNGLPNQSLFLATSPFLAIIDVNDGSDYTQVDNFLFSGPTDRVYTVTVDNGGRALITFGDNVSGRAPTGNVTITYKVGGGSAGNVDAGAITQVDGTILDVSSNPVQLIVTNGAAATGGTDPETAPSIRVNAPASIRAPRTSIAREDFEIHAVEIAGVARALMQTHEQDPVGIPDNSGILYVVPSGNPPGTPSAGLLDSVRRVFVGGAQAKPKFPAPLTFALTTLAAPYLSVSVSARLYLVKGADPTVVGAAIRQALADFFNPVIQDAALAAKLGVEVGAPNSLIDFGFNLRLASAAVTPPITGTIAISDVEDVVNDVPGVRRIGAAEADFLVNGSRTFPGDVEVENNTFPVLGSVTLFNIDTGLSF